jgi:hypothetical protein
VGSTHKLESPYRKASQGMEKMRDSKGYSRTGEPRRRAKSVMERAQVSKGRSPTEGAQTVIQVMTRNECEPVRGTYILESQMDKCVRP